MAVRKPLYLGSGLAREFASGDALDSAFLENVVAAATVGSASAIPVVTYDAKGRIISTTTALVSSGRAFAYFS